MCCLRAIGALLRWPDATKLGTDSFRSGAERALIASGATFAQHLQGGQIRESALRLCLVLGDPGERCRKAMMDMLRGSDVEPH